MKENILVINQNSEKYDVREGISSFFEKYEEHYYSVVRVRTKDKKIFTGIVNGMRYALHLENFSGGHKSIWYEDITSVKILHNRELFQVIHSLTKKNEALSEKRLKEITKNMKELIKTAKSR